MIDICPFNAMHSSSNDSGNINVCIRYISSLTLVAKSSWNGMIPVYPRDMGGVAVSKFAFIVVVVPINFCCCCFCLFCLSSRCSLV